MPSGYLLSHVALSSEAPPNDLSWAYLTEFSHSHQSNIGFLVSSSSGILISDKSWEAYVEKNGLGL
jgi:hypothetical protein